MATYAIGDIQACHRELEQLLDRLHFKPSHDRLWLTGDLVGRGPQPLATLRTVHRLGDAATMVLGNHDLHLLAQAAGVTDRNDRSLQEVLEAPDREELLDWLRCRPLLHIDRELGYGMIHAGLAPQWDTDTARCCASEVEARLRSEAHPGFLASMYGDKPDTWTPGLAGTDRLRFITNCLTRLRFCTPDGRLALREKGGPGEVGPDLAPWFSMPQRQSGDLQWLFGHWSTLGQVHWPEHRVYGLDSGCIWGGALTALCLETGEITQLPCEGYRKPG